MMASHHFVEPESFVIVSFGRIIIIDQQIFFVDPVDPLLELIEIPDEQKNIIEGREYPQQSRIQKKILNELDKP
jgi:hypothetical protein